jgi:uncharacterized membrane protein YkvA (DUF1232 family)
MGRIVAHIKREISFYRLVLQDPRVPRYAKWLLGLAVAYAVSPIDLIPDFIPVVGHLDDLLIVPLLAGQAMLAVPAEVVRDCRARAGSEPSVDR